MRIAVVGAHLTGQPLNHQLTSRDARLVEQTRTAPIYRLFALDTVPPKPGLLRTAEGTAGRRAPSRSRCGSSTPPASARSSTRSRRRCASGASSSTTARDVAGFLCEPVAAEGAADITHHGGWRAYRAAAPG